MSQRGLKQVLDYSRQALPPDDGQLLLRFVAGRDEDAFATLVRRHGPMVLSVCRRLLHHAQDAEDAFQATFLVLACKAAAVAKREAVGSFLYGVAYHTALKARDANLRRRRRERQVEDLPEPATGPAEPQDWRPLLDRELNRLPGKYREALVLCDLEGKGRKEAARLLGLPEWTLSSRLATGRRLLAKRLSRYGLMLSGGALATALSAEAPAAVPAALLVSTVQAALLVAAGQLAAVSTQTALLMKGVLKAMFVQKLKVIGAAVLVAVALGAGGLAYQAAEPAGPGKTTPQGAKAASELEALRKENELLRLNLLVLLEKIRAQEAEVATLKRKQKEAAPTNAVPLGKGVSVGDFDNDGWPDVLVTQYGGVKLFRNNGDGTFTDATEQAGLKDPLWAVSAAFKALQEARDPEAKRRAAEALEKAVKKLRGHPDPNAPTK